MNVSARIKRKASVDVSPMIDVIFQLVLFFLVSVSFSAVSKISVNLPQSTSSAAAQPSAVEIVSRKDGTVMLNGADIPIEDLPAALSKLDTGGLQKREVPVVLCADRDVTAGRIAEIFDAVREGGFASVQLRTEQK